MLDDLIRQITDRPGDTSLDHLTRACVMADHLDEVADHLVGHFVDQARRDGMSWTAIGASMGVSKQAAQQRFTAGATDRFTNRAQVVVLKAENDARDRGHREVTTVHLVLGLLAEWKGVAGRALKAAGLSRATVARAAVAALDPPRPPTVEHGVPSPGLARVYELAARESVRLGHGYVGTEHLLLGLLAAPEEPGAQVLAGLGVSRAAVEAWVLQALADLRAARAATAG